MSRPMCSEYSDIVFLYWMEQQILINTYIHVYMYMYIFRHTHWLTQINTREEGEEEWMGRKFTGSQSWAERKYDNLREDKADKVKEMYCHSVSFCIRPMCDCSPSLQLLPTNMLRSDYCEGIQSYRTKVLACYFALAMWRKENYIIIMSLCSG